MGEDRGAAMAASVVRALRSLGVDPGSVSGVSRAHALAMALRERRLPHDRHPLFLHPGRTILILLRDVGFVEPDGLMAAAVSESEDPSLRVPSDLIRQELGEGVARLTSAVPEVGSEDTLEALVSAEPGVQLVALAERLDQLRHMHLMEGDRVWRETRLREAETVYLPVAERTHPVLTRRFRHWCRTARRGLT